MEVKLLRFFFLSIFLFLYISYHIDEGNFRERLQLKLYMRLKLDENINVDSMCYALLTHQSNTFGTTTTTNYHFGPYELKKSVYVLNSEMSVAKGKIDTMRAKILIFCF